MRVADSLIDKVFLNRVRLFNVGIVAYLLWISFIMFNWLRDFLLGNELRLCITQINGSVCIPIYIGVIIVLSTFIAWVGSAVVPLMDYVSTANKSRRLYYNIYQTMSLLVRDKPNILELDNRFLIAGLVTLNSLIAVWLWVLDSYDPAFISLKQTLLIDHSRGMLAMLFNALALSTMILFWNACCVVFLNIIYAYQWFLRSLSRSLKREIESMDALSLEVLIEEIVNSERPGLLFLNYWLKLHKPLEDVATILKRIIVTIISAILIPYMLDILTGQRGLGVGTVSGIFIGIGLSIPTIYLSAVFARYSGLLKSLMEVELKDIRVRALVQGNERLQSVAEEIEALLNSMGSPLINMRELLELIVAIASLLATIITVLLSSLGV